MLEPPDPMAPRASAEDGPGPRRPDLVPDAIEDVVYEVADSARSVGGHASHTAHAVGPVGGL